MADWDDLARELDLWEVAGLRPSLWWRDDDLVGPSPALKTLREVARGFLALAVIPLAPDRPLEDGLADFVADWPQAAVLQHGIGHLNHALGGAKKSEFPPGKPLPETSAGLAAGKARLEAAFGARFLPVLTPPWNRVAGDLLPHLPGRGYRGLSRFGEPPYNRALAVPGLLEVDTHVDVIDWRGGRGFAGEAACLDRLTGHLIARRSGTAAASLPTGILTHHLVHDAATWRFLANLQDWLAKRGTKSAGNGYFTDPAVLWPAH